jgi:hypothetical protein
MENDDIRTEARFFCGATVKMPPLSAKLQKMMKGWQLERKTQPRRNTLASASAARMTRQQIINFLNRNLMVYPNTIKNVEHRMRNLAVQNNKMREYALKYSKRHLAKSAKSRSVARSIGRKWLSKTKK